MKKLCSLFATLTLALQAVIAAPFDTVFHKAIFENQLIHFDEKKNPGSIVSLPDGTLIIANGRIVLKKLSLPRFRRDHRATLHVRLQSNGDPWDKTGSCFIIPSASQASMITVAQGKKPYPALDTTRYERLSGIVGSQGYLPPVELMRFMTPFGVGYYTPKDDATREAYTPVYIDEWAPYAEWWQDVTDRLPLLCNDSAYVGLAIDSWLPSGYIATVELTIEESRLKADKAPRRYIVPLCNTIQYYQQEFCDIFNRRPLEVDFSLPQNAREATLYYIVSGHGGHAGGDEFTPQENILSLDGKELKRFTPWRTDCASFRRFNPSTGVWLQKRKVRFIGHGGREVKEVEEPLASSDKSRSNWCPGSDVPPLKIALPPLAKGTHTLTIDIPKAQAFVGQAMNHWLVSAWIAWEE